VHGHSAASRSHARPRSGPGDAVSREGALWPRVGGARGASLAAARGGRARGPGLARGADGPLRVGGGRRAPGRELHRLRSLRVRPPGAPWRSGPGGGGAPRGPDGRSRAALPLRAARRAQHRGAAGLRRGGEEERHAADALCAAPAVHDRGAHRLGRRRGHGVLLRLAAGRPGSVHRVLPGRAQLRGRSAGPRHAGVRAGDLRPGPAGGRVPAARRGARRPRRGASPSCSTRWPWPIAARSGSTGSGSGLGRPGGAAVAPAARGGPRPLPARAAGRPATGRPSSAGAARARGRARGRGSPRAAPGSPRTGWRRPRCPASCSRAPRPGSRRD
jgi:hypothetical protein